MRVDQAMRFAKSTGYSDSAYQQALKGTQLASTFLGNYGPAYTFLMVRGMARDVPCCVAARHSPVSPPPATLATRRSPAARTQRTSR